jgi:hypothetical protein
MLIQFKFKNHKCFYDETYLDLMATQEKRHIESTISVNGNNILPVIAIHGANASGKSSALEALDFMFEFIKFSNRIDVKNDLPTNPYGFSKKSIKENSEYEVSICLGDNEYRYGFSLNKNQIDEEWLYTKRFALNTRASQKMIFERNNNQVSFGKGYSKYEKTWNLFGNDTNLNTNKLLVLSNIAIKEETGILRDLYDYICKFEFRIESEFKKASIDILNKNDSVYEKFQKIINEFDPCLLGIKIEEVDGDNEKKYNISGMHKNIDDSNTAILIPLHKESNGTIRIFNIMPTILKNLEVGGLLCIDEVDVKLHPLLYKKIVSMYMDKSINKNNAQLIYTAHSTFLFNSNDLRRDQLYLVDKDEYGKSKLYSLSEFRNLRADADYEKKYLSGQFGAIPYEN